MKDNISIIFTAIIGTFLIVLLPLYSILDRQDSMSYNVVLTETTNFVDNIRNNGFVDRDSYYNYVDALASTSNTYKITIEAYRKTLIHDTDEFGNIISDSYVEEIELYNTQDILEVLAGEVDENVDNSNKKNNVYLFNQNDEIYVKVYNTNITAGSVIYNVVAGDSNSQVINVSYGGVVNKVNWELYDKIQAETTLVPEVIMSVPVNGINSTNIKKVTEDNILENLDCSIENLDEYIGETSVAELCNDIVDSISGENYTYLYDLADENNKTIRVAVELRRFNSINTGINNKGEEIYTKLSEIKESDFKDYNGIKSSIESYIIRNYIQLNGMYAGVDLSLRKTGDYYFFDIVLTDVRMSELDYISSLASITILPGLGQDENGTLAIGAETVQIELTDATAVNTVIISMPHIWNKLLKTKSLTDSRILDGVVYAKEDIAFMISYTGINGQSDEDIVDAIRQKLKIYIAESDYSNIEIFTADELNDNYGINIRTGSAGHVFVKFRYNKANNSNHNYIQLTDGWIATNIEEVIDAQQDEDLLIYANGAKSSEYSVLLDDLPPLEPTIELEGVSGNNGWYKSNVTLHLIGSRTDTVQKYIVIKDDAGNASIVQRVELGGSGVYRNTLTLEGAITRREQEVSKTVLNIDGTSYAIAKSYDYVGNEIETERKEIKIDKTKPTAPEIKISGIQGQNGWYTSNVKIEITPGTDATSGVAKTTYKIEGANKLNETKGTSYTLTKEGTSTVIATTYDNAGNKTETRVIVNIEKTEPFGASFSVINGEKNSSDNEWYYTDVTLRITANVDTVSGFDKASYRITGSSEVPTTSFDGKTKEITIDTNGTHNIEVYTYTKAGNYKKRQYTVKIDKQAPNEPTVEIKGTEGENNWYTSNVEVAVTSNGDAGTSSEYMMTYEIINKDAETIGEKEIANNGKIFFNEEGEYTLRVYSRDNALNKVEVEKVIKIDKTSPTSATFRLRGIMGKNDWFVTDVKISYDGATDEISGIQNVTLSRESITENTDGTVVTLTTKDNAGHTVTKELTIKLDKSAPLAPEINLSANPTGMGDEPFGVLLYNQNVGITVIPGKDYFIEGIDNLDKTTLEVTAEDGNQVLLAETETTSFDIDYEGIITVTARTYDKAGNVTIASKVIWIDKTKPQTPKLISINGESIGDVATKEVTGTTNKLSLGIDNLTEKNDVKIVIINKTTYERTEITKTATSNNLIDVELKQKGTYSITVTQTNMFGTESDESTGLYYYKYE